MILQSIYEIIDYIRIGTIGLMGLLIFILIIVVGVSNLKKELCPDCKKGFSRFFVAFLIFIMFSTFMDFAYALTNQIFWQQFLNGNISINYYSGTMNMIWGITHGLGLVNKIIANILLFSAMEIHLFNKKSKWKFGILSIILLGGIFIMEVVRIVLFYTIGGIGYNITNVVVLVLSSLNYIILAIFILILLKKTSNENENIKTYTKPISVGVVFMLIIVPLIKPITTIVYLFGVLIGFPYEIYYWINQSVFLITNIAFIIGIIVLAVGSIKTLSVPLTFSRGKRVKGSPRQQFNTTTNSCPSCGAPLPPGAEFCTNCGNHL